MNRRASFILAFCALYLVAQVSLIVRGQFAPSKHFGFWMFPESTYFVAHLSRVLTDGSEVATDRGSWFVETDSGKAQRYDWQSFVRGYRLDRLDKRVRSKGTFHDTLGYFQAALTYVAERIPDDTATDQLVLTINYQKAGGPQQTVVLRSPPRLGAASDGS